MSDDLLSRRRERFGALTYRHDTRRLAFERRRSQAEIPLAEHLNRGLDAPICLTWELTYACNLACIHCLSSSGRRDPHELTTDEAIAVVDELGVLQVFYINIGGGEPMLRPDFFELVEYATTNQVGVKFSTNGTFVNRRAAERLASMSYLDIQVSLDGVDAPTNDSVHGHGSYARARSAMDHLAAAGFGPLKISVVVTRHNVDQFDAFKALADGYGAQLRVTRLRPSGRGADSWHRLHPTQDQQRTIYHWLRAHGDEVLTGDSFFHLNALGPPLPGLNLCGAGRVVCLIDPVGDVFACPFAIHEQFRAGSVRAPGGLTEVWRNSRLFGELRQPAAAAGACAGCGGYDACQGGCMATKFFTGMSLDGPDPECVNGHGEPILAGVAAGSAPRPSVDHSRPVSLRTRPPTAASPGHRPDPG